MQSLSSSRASMSSAMKMSLSGAMLGYLVLLLLLASMASHTPTRSGGGGGSQVDAKSLHKRSFSGLGCLGTYDKSKFARLDRICEECYQMYREPDIHSTCRQDCFRNRVFSHCVSALLLSTEEKRIIDMVDEMYGK